MGEKLKKGFSFTILSLLAGGLVACLVIFSSIPDKIGFTGAVIATVGISFVIMLSPKAVHQPLLVALAIRFTLALVQHFIFPLPNSQKDAVAFERIGWDLAQGWHQGTPFQFITGPYTYSMLIGMVYYLLGRSPLLIQVINVFFSTLTVVNVFRIAQTAWQDQRIAQRAAWIVALFPTLNLFGAITLREALIVYLFTLGILYLVRWSQTDRMSNFIKSLVALSLMIDMHSGLFPILFVPFFLLARRWLGTFIKGKFLNWLHINIAMVVLIMVIATLVITGIGLEKIGRHISFQTIAQRQQIHARGRARYLSGWVADSPGALLIQLPVRIVYFLFAPFPWSWQNLEDVMGGFDALLYLWLVWQSFCGMRQLKRFNPTIFWILALTISIGVLVFAIGTSNYGTAVRHRAKFVWLLAIFAAYAIHYNHGRETCKQGSERKRARE